MSLVKVIEKAYFGLDEYINQKNGIEIHNISPNGKKNGEIFYATINKSNGKNKINIFKKTYNYMDMETAILKSEQVTFTKENLYHLKNLKGKTEIYEHGPNGNKHGATVYAEKKGKNILITKENFNYNNLQTKILRIEKIEIPQEKISELEKILKG